MRYTLAFHHRARLRVLALSVVILAAGGNSDGDHQMLQWTAAGPGRRLMLLVDHTDAAREFAYRVSPMGRLEQALDEAHQRGWIVVSMKDDWRRVFAFEP